MNNNLINELYKKIDAQDKMINEQVLEIARLKEDKKKAIEYIKEHNVLAVNKEYLPSGIERCCSAILLEILGGNE